MPENNKDQFNKTSNNNEYNIEDEITKSVEKMVEEETNVARATYSVNNTQIPNNQAANNVQNGQIPNVNGQADYYNNYNYAQTDMGKTQVIPDVSAHLNMNNSNTATQQYNRQPQQAGQSAYNRQPQQQAGQPAYNRQPQQQAGQPSYNRQSQQQAGQPSYNRQPQQQAVQPSYNRQPQQATRQQSYNVQHPVVNKTQNADKQINENDNLADNISETSVKKPMDKKTKIVIAAVAAGVAVVVALIIVVAVIINNNNKKGYNYNYNKGIELYDNHEYSSAIDYLSKAAKDNNGKRNLELKYKLYECYNATGDENNAVETLKDILSYDKNYEKAIKSLIDIYVKQKNGTAMTELIRSYKGSVSEKYFTSYMVSEPKPSVEAGSYDDTIQLQLTSDGNEKIYYTTDNTEPSDKSTLYNNDVISIENGTTIIKAIAINDMGIISDVATFKYVVEYKKPDAPSISPASGTYQAGQKISIMNIPEGYKVYYTLDGTTPTDKSTEYTGEFEMPEGNTVVSAIMYDTHNQASTVTKRNYVVNPAKSYSYDEALNILKNRLVSKGVLKSGGNTTSDGASASFVYNSKTTINGTEMYCIRFDIRKNGNTTTAGYYGVGVKNGQCYKVTINGNSYSAASY